MLFRSDLEDMRQGNARTIGINMPSRYTYLNLFAVPGRWGDLPDEELLMAELTIKVRISIDVSSP